MAARSAPPHRDPSIGMGGAQHPPRSLPRLTRRRLRDVKIAVVAALLWLLLSLASGGAFAGLVLLVAFTIVAVVIVAVLHERGLGLAPSLLVAARARPWRNREDMIRASLRAMTRTGLYRGPSGTVTAASDIVVAWPTSALDGIADHGGVRPIEAALAEGWASIVWEYGADVLADTDIRVDLAHDPTLPDGVPAARIVDIDSTRTARVLGNIAAPIASRVTVGGRDTVDREAEPQHSTPQRVAPPPGYARTRVQPKAEPDNDSATSDADDVPAVPGSARLRPDVVVESTPWAATVHVTAAAPVGHSTPTHDHRPSRPPGRPPVEQNGRASDPVVRAAADSETATAMPQSVLAPRIVLAGCNGSSVGTTLAPAFAGRSAGAEMPLEFLEGTDTISRVHARFDWVDDRWTVSPVKARPGLMVNGKHVPVGAALQDGDVITWGLSPRSPRSVVRLG